MVSAWVSSLLEPVGDECPALVVESDDALLLLLAQAKLDHLAALRVDRILRKQTYILKLQFVHLTEQIIL